MRRTRGKEKGVGKLALELRNKVKVGSFGLLAKKLGLILILSGASQHEKPCCSSTFTLEPRESFGASMLVLMISREM